MINFQSGVQSVHIRHQIVGDYHVGKCDITKFNE